MFSDLHANKRALGDVIPAIEDADLSVFCGDLLGYGKDIDFCVDYVTKHVDIVVQGDHERMAITDEDLSKQLAVVRDSAAFTKKNLSLSRKRRLAFLPVEVWREGLYVTHSLGDDYLRTEKDFERLATKLKKNTRYAFFGHTHEQALFDYGDAVMVNPGSITKGRRGCPRSYAVIENDVVHFVNLEDIL